MDFAFVTWNVNPDMFSIGSFAVRWYGFLFALGIALSYLIIQRIFKHEKLPDALFDKLSIYIVLATIIGARLGHVLFYEPRAYLADPISIFYFRQGGLASHGAAIGILFAIWLFSRKTKMSYLWTVDRIVIVVALSGCLIRIGNLMNSEIYGHITNLPWGFIFVRNGETLPKHPTQIYEALVCLFTFIYLYRYYYKNYPNLKPGFMLGILLVVIFGMRFLIEFIKEPQVDFENNMLLNMGQLLSIPFVLVGVYFIVRSRRKQIPEQKAAEQKS